MALVHYEIELYREPRGRKSTLRAARRWADQYPLAATRIYRVTPLGRTLVTHS